MLAEVQPADLNLNDDAFLGGSSRIRGAHCALRAEGSVVTQ
jgi:hypothetical protein